MQKTLEQAKTEYELEVIAKMTAETQKLVKDVLVAVDVLQRNILSESDKAQSDRDHIMTCVESIMVFLEQNKPTEKATEKAIGQKIDLAKIKWESATGPKGPYELTNDSDNPEYKALHRYLADHNGKATIDEFFLSVFQNGVTIGKWKAKYRMKA